MIKPEDIIGTLNSAIKQALEEEIEHELNVVRAKMVAKRDEIVAGISVKIMKNVSFERMGPDLIIRIQNFNQE